MSKASGNVRIFTMVNFCHMEAHIGEQHIIRLSTTSISSLSFKARELNFAYRLLILMPKELPKGFLKFCFKAEFWGFF